MFCDTRNMSIHCKAVTHTDTLADKYTDILTYFENWRSINDSNGDQIHKKLNSVTVSNSVHT